MFVRGSVKKNVYPLAFSFQLFLVPDIRQKKMGFRVAFVMLFLKKKLGLVAIQADQFLNSVCMEKLVYKFAADGAAGAGYKYFFVCEV
jgi:hypothetical protein